jgi:DNA-binding GntR family transcriptional regulator
VGTEFAWIKGVVRALADGSVMNSIAKLVRRGAPTAPLTLGPVNATSLRDQAYQLLRTAIAETDIYDPQQELRLDERQLTAALGVSRTPIREALAQLEQEGFIRTVPRRGIYIVRKSKRDVIEMIQMWAALESMAARLATLHASDADIATLRHLFDEFQSSPPSEHLDEYSDANIAFHAAVIALGGSQTIIDATRNLLTHVRAIRRATITQDDRAARSIIDHLKIIEALEKRDTELAERLTRQHTLDLAAHVERYCNFLD